MRPMAIVDIGEWYTWYTKRMAVGLNYRQLSHFERQLMWRPSGDCRTVNATQGLKTAASVLHGCGPTRGYTGRCCAGTGTGSSFLTP